MPVKWLLHPHTGAKLSFEEAPRILEDAGIMPSYAVEAVIKEYRDDEPSFFVRPSDVQPTFTCRRQRVWQATHDYGINPNMIYDYTLPRTHSHKCQNSQCPSNLRTPLENPEIIIFQYNPDILNIGYMCSECRTYWKS